MPQQNQDIYFHKQKIYHSCLMPNQVLQTLARISQLLIRLLMYFVFSLSTFPFPTLDQSIFWIVL